MFRKFFALFSIFLLLSGCAMKPSRDGIISKELPLTVDDLGEIRAGQKNHERVLWEYKIYDSPKLQQYCNAVAASLAEVSTRPHLPYKVVLLDDEEINIFGGPGGFIYITKGMFDFIESEAELAGAIAHEIIHVADYDYSHVPHLSKMQKAYNVMLQGTELAKSSVGSYGTAANYGVKGIGKAAPVIARRFGHDEEIQTDEKALEVLVAAGYDPRGYLRFVEKLTKVDMDQIGRFAIFMNTHPPFAQRREILNNRISGMKLADGKVDFKKDMMLTEVRQVTVNAADSIVFQPNPEGQAAGPMELQSVDREKKDSMSSYRDKRWAWF
jgi:predicted Zn-dependent protease